MSQVDDLRFFCDRINRCSTTFKSEHGHQINKRPLTLPIGAVSGRLFCQYPWKVSTNCHCRLYICSIRSLRFPLSQVKKIVQHQNSISAICNSIFYAKESRLCKPCVEKPPIRANVQTVCRKCAAAFLHKERTPNLTI